MLMKSDVGFFSSAKEQAHRDLEASFLGLAEKKRMILEKEVKQLEHFIFTTLDFIVAAKTP